MITKTDAKCVAKDVLKSAIMNADNIIYSQDFKLMNNFTDADIERISEQLSKIQSSLWHRLSHK